MVDSISHAHSSGSRRIRSTRAGAIGHRRVTLCALAGGRGDANTREAVRTSRGEGAGERTIAPVISIADVRAARDAAARIYLDDKIREYIVNLVQATRTPADYRVNVAELVQFGASPRATICLAQALPSQDHRLRILRRSRRPLAAQLQRAGRS